MGAASFLLSLYQDQLVDSKMEGLSGYLISTDAKRGARSATGFSAAIKIVGQLALLLDPLLLLRQALPYYL